MIRYLLKIAGTLACVGVYWSLWKGLEEALKVSNSLVVAVASIGVVALIISLIATVAILVVLLWSKEARTLIERMIK